MSVLSAYPTLDGQRKFSYEHNQFAADLGFSQRWRCEADRFRFFGGHDADGPIALSGILDPIAF